jgi:hypothetical protein
MKWKEETKQNKTNNGIVMVWILFEWFGRWYLWRQSNWHATNTPVPLLLVLILSHAAICSGLAGWLATAKSQAAMVTRPEQTIPPAAF